MPKKIIPLAQWAKKQKTLISARHARRLALEGKIPMKKIPTFIMGISEDYTYKK